ncbi:SGNH/GDSL hydrolase family protein [Leptolyngbya sp. NK1-12]|nr:SGNH/GDSL hydrolase family protein [Leptolyngbya sp. NK1-12]
MFVRRMRERQLRSVAHFFKFSPLLLRLKLLPTWVLVSLATNAFLLLTLLMSMWRQADQPQASESEQVPYTAAGELATSAPPPFGTATSTQSGERHQLTYEQWLDQLRQEANAIVEQQPERLTVLVGDSISLWFPNELLPPERFWLNQGISGETSHGLLKRLDLFEKTKPETIFVMIGINDLLRGTSDQEILDNQRQIIRDLDAAHPQAQIVVQSILPHAKQATWEGRERLLEVSNQRIQDLNKQLETLARQEGVYFLDLYPLFANPDGDLRPELSTDGLHLSTQGYQTWSIALQVYSREVLNVD